MAVLGNHLLPTLSERDLEIISTDLVPVGLSLHAQFECVDEPIEKVCFPEEGVISVVAVDGLGHQIEAGLIGFEGMTGVSLIMGDDRSPNLTTVQSAGSGYTLTAEALAKALASSHTLRNQFLRYAQTFCVQIAQTALANGRAMTPERLARWLLMADDRIHGPELALTHEYLSIMLGVRRSGVTDAIHRLEGERLIWASRGKIILRNRAGLEQLSRGSYGVFEREYERLFGRPWQSTLVLPYPADEANSSPS